jgi:hypothetical protein
MFTHRLFISKKLNLITKKSLKILKKTSLSHDFSTTTVDFNAFKDEDEHTGASLLQLRRNMKLTNVEFYDGITNIKTSCPACDCKEQNKDIYINKTTGNAIISKFYSLINIIKYF